MMKTGEATTVAGRASAPGLPMAASAVKFEKDLPAFVVFSTLRRPQRGSCSGSGFLPTTHQGVQLPFDRRSGARSFQSRGVDNQLQQDSLEAIKRLNQMKLDTTVLPGDRDADCELRDGLPDADERAGAPRICRRSPSRSSTCTAPTRPSPSFANTVLLARRLSERGVPVRGDLPRGVGPARDSSRTLPRTVKTPTRRARRSCRISSSAACSTIRSSSGRRVRPDPDGAGRQRLAAIIIRTPSRCGRPCGGFKPGITYGETDGLGFNVSQG
jgi:hypothetical protein